VNSSPPPPPTCAILTHQSSYVEHERTHERTHNHGSELIQVVICVNVV